jgi:ABC-type spermidine/putrescine transport system permease subunit I
VSEATTETGRPPGFFQRWKAGSGRQESGVWYPRWFWQAWAAPGTLWLIVLFILPFYVVICVAFGTTDIFQNPVPVWQPWYWTVSNVTGVYHKIFGSNAFLEPVFTRTFAYVIAASLICIVLGYTVAYYVSRYGGKRKTLFLVLLISPFWVSYLMRMLAWVNLLQTDGYVNKIVTFLHLAPRPVAWLEGRPLTVILGLVYGYIPYMILPIYGFLDRIDQSLLEAGRDLGGSPVSTFVRVTLPLSKPAILAGLVIVTLPMFGDYYTNNLLSNSPKTTMIGNVLDDAIESPGQGPQGAVFVLILMILLIIPMLYYMRSTRRSLEDA